MQNKLNLELKNIRVSKNQIDHIREGNDLKTYTQTINFTVNKVYEQMINKK